ncbi:type II secretion system F family protein [Cohnella sp. GCM10027633]|uniref:type II secretion system F family protein n=1 Tax=unclassified Cohnella TaxID=2636738 RepID=UPI003634000C
MLTFALISLSAVLFLLFFVSIRFGMAAWSVQQSRKRRLASYRDNGWSKLRDRQLAKLGKPYVHVSDMLLALGWKVGPNGFALLSLAMALLGIATGVLLFQSIRSVVLLFAVLGSMPYVMLRMSLVNRQMATRLEFLPAVELFYQSYLISGRRHVRIALQKTVEERRLGGRVQFVFDQLYRNLSVRSDDDGSIRRFALSFGHVWADYFANIVKVSLEEGNDISANLKELIADMRKSQMDNQAERHRLLEIRLANFTPIVFLALFLGINFRLNHEASYRYYVTDPGGRAMLLNAIVLLFLSFMMGLYLSRRKL